MTGWKTTPGGLSDAKIFSEYGIPSVNLSVDYKNEHTVRSHTFDETVAALYK